MVQTRSEITCVSVSQNTNLVSDDCFLDCGVRTPLSPNEELPGLLGLGALFVLMFVASEVKARMAIFAEGYQVDLAVITKVTARADVMNLKAVQPAAILAPPAIAFQDLPMKLFVSSYVEFDARTLLVD